MKRLWISVAAVGVAAVLLHVGVSSCGQPHPPGKPKVACTTTILADIARSVAGPHVDVVSLANPLDDPHGLASTPEMVRSVGESWAVFENGLGLEPWLDGVVKAAPGDHPRWVATKGVSPLMREDGTPDPHAWLDPRRAETYVLNARDMLISLDPDHEGDFRTNADALIESLKGLDAEITNKAESLPLTRRRLLTVHDSMRYFAARYGFETHALAPPGVAPTTEMNEAATNWLMKDRTPVMFWEAGRDEEGIRALSFKNGRRVVGPLWTDTLDAPGKPEGSYLGAMRSLADQIALGLR